MARKKKSIREGVANYKNKNYWAVKRFARGFLPFGYQLNIVGVANNDGDVTKDTSFTAVYSIEGNKDWYMEVEFDPYDREEKRCYCLNVFFHFGCAENCKDDDPNILIYSDTDICDEDGVDDELLNQLDFIMEEPELAWYRVFFGTDFNTMYVSRREAKKFYKKFIKTYRKNQESLLENNVVDFKEEEDSEESQA